MMPPIDQSIAALKGVLFKCAVALTALSLLVAPFRSSAGLRAAAFVVAGVMLVALWWRNGWRTRQPVIRIPSGALLRTSVVLWVLGVFVYSVAGPDPRTSLASWRGDVLTPLLAAIVCYSLAHGKPALGAWLLALLAGLLVLTGMVMLDPFQPVIGAYEPRYLGVGWLSTWVVMLAALLPLAWLLPWPRPRRVPLAAIVALLTLAALLIAAWFSANRIVWLCFGSMLLVYTVLNFRHMGGSTARRLGLVALGVVAALAMFFATSGMRAAQFPDAKLDGVSILQKDDRQLIWAAAINAIRERPFAGYGYALEAANDAVASRLADVGMQRVFRHAHNVVLNHAVQMGVPGALMIVLLFIGLAHAFWSRRRHSAMATALASCGLMLVVGFVLRNMTDDFFHRHAALLFGALVGMLLALCDRAAEPSLD